MGLVRTLTEVKSSKMMVSNTWVGDESVVLLNLPVVTYILAMLTRDFALLAPKYNTLLVALSHWCYHIKWNQLN
jgi:hypothetical protein